MLFIRKCYYNNSGMSGWSQESLHMFIIQKMRVDIASLSRSHMLVKGIEPGCYREIQAVRNSTLTKCHKLYTAAFY